MTTFAEFKELSTKGNVVPVFEALRADLETPVSVYLKIRTESPYSFLLESVEGGDAIGRYSFIGFNPFMKFMIRGKEYSVDVFHEDVQILPKLIQDIAHPLDALKILFAHFKTVRTPELPRLVGGAVGYFGYDCIQLIEDVPSSTTDDLQLPDAELLFFDVVIVFDNVQHQMFLVSNAYVNKPGLSEEELKHEYEKATDEITNIKRLLSVPVSHQHSLEHDVSDIVYSTSRSDFLGHVDYIKKLIVEGDIFQAVLSQRLTRNVTVNHFDLYRALRSINPSPYMYYLRLDTYSIIGSSPEMLVRVEQGMIETRPIAGTRKRGSTVEEDQKLERDLLSDTKERAEHLMLVDLGRNDIGRVSEYGSVEVSQFMSIERYSHVMHIVSSIHGRLRKELSPIDAFFACFPAGTLTGAPKIRAMEIIADVEPVKRGIYGGAIAYIDFSGNLDSCIVIRTMIATEDAVHFQAGAGIVSDSQPAREYEETLEKLAATLKAFNVVQTSVT